MSDYLIAHIKWLEDRLSNEIMDDFTRSQVLSALGLAEGYYSTRSTNHKD
jgi:hypothetical protein